mgnify:FL=1|jgi:hypothetical protein|tara:strand:+ start:1308 stop:2123 length:816 start_codon:yes stop_codon:yes gene_type:complete
MAFFKLFPKIGYDLNNTGVLQNVVNIYRSIRPLREFVDDVSVYTLYEIKNGERPDIVSQRLYGTPDYYWTFFIVNDYLHDGLASWPMSQEDLSEYMRTEYDGFAITTRPVIRRNTDQLIIDHENSLSGRFKLGETLTGSQGNATGTLTKKLTDLNQLIVQNVTGSFIGDPDAVPNQTEVVTGGTSEDSVDTYRVYKYLEAPYHYFVEDDIEQRVADNGIFIQGATPESNLSFLTNRAHLINSNESRSSMRVVSPEYISQFVDKFEELLNNE